ncbi:MAG: RQC domain-containing protein [Oscillospiraceae bacterium]
MKMKSSHRRSAPGSRAGTWNGWTRWWATAKPRPCLRRYLLDYFGEHLAEPCGHCSSCQGNFVERDITVEAQKILSGVARVERMYPYGLGVNQVIHMLRGSRNQRVLGLKLDTLPTYGILREVPREQVQIYVDCLVERGYLVVTKTEFPVVHLTAQARRVLFEGSGCWRHWLSPPGRRPHCHRRKLPSRWAL